MTPNNHVHIIGAGVIGLCSAWYLRKAGFDVTVIDGSTPGTGCSFGNAGMIVPSHFVPLAAPGVIAKGLSWMFRSDSPFFIRPRLNSDLMRWLWQFRKASTLEKMNAAMPVLRDLSLLSKSLYQELSKTDGLDFGYRDSGLLILCKTQHGLAEETDIAEQAHALGLHAELLNTQALEKLDTGIQTKVAGGIFYPGDALIRPDKFMSQMRDQLINQGVVFKDSCEVTGFVTSSTHIKSMICNDGDIIAMNNVVVAGGSLSSRLTQKLGIRLLLQDGKGYSVTVPAPKPGPSVPAILCEAKVAVSPYGNQLRIGGTLEISNHSPSISRPRLGSIIRAMSEYYQGIAISEPDIQHVWHGFRPCTPDGLPYIGKSHRYTNLTIATGHAMMGMSLGPATGMLVSQIMTDQKPAVNCSLFDVDRYQ